MNGFVKDQAENLRELVDKQRRELKIITVTSGKGGVGKSSISVNLAIALSRLGARVLVIDADFGLANIDVILGIATRYNISHFLRGEKQLSEIIQMGYGGVRFISGGSGVYELLNMDESQLQTLLSGIINMDSPADIIICDTGAGINDHIVQLVLASTETIVVTTPEPTAILDSYALIKTVARQGKDHPMHLIMNKCDSKKEAENVINGFVDVIQKHMGKRIDPIGYIFYDHEIPQSIKKQTPIIISNPTGSTARELTAIAKTILDIPTVTPPNSMLSRIFGRLLK